MKIAAIIAVLVISAAIVIWLVRRGAGPKLGEIAPAQELQEKYGLYAENRPEINLDPANVPEHLRHLAPLAEKWGIGDDIIRGDVIDKATPAEKQELHDALYEPFEEITKWLDSFEDLSDEAAAFMYMQLASDEMGLYILDEKKANTQQGAEHRQ